MFKLYEAQKLFPNYIIPVEGKEKQNMLLTGRNIKYDLLVIFHMIKKDEV